MFENVTGRVTNFWGGWKVCKMRGKRTIPLCHRKQDTRFGRSNIGYIQGNAVAITIRFHP